MAELLGGEAIIESLKKDVQDLQWAVGEVVSRIGPVQHTSWKFPDKMSCDLDIDDLLDLYSFTDDAEECQVAHIALYELVIDRFVYLVQSLSAYSKQLLTRTGGEIIDSNSTSVGLVAKQFCNRQIQLQTVVQQTMSDIKSKNRRLMDMESNMKKLCEDIQSHTGSQTSLNSVNSQANSVMSGIYTASQFVEVARDANSKSSQTVETAFIPCEACNVVQKCFRNSGDVVINMCRNQKLPSGLQQYRPLVAEVKWLSANDVARWAGEQMKDMNRIDKNMDTLLETISSLKEEVSTFETKCKKLEKRVANFDADMSREREVQSALRKQFDMKVKDLEHDHRETVAVVTMEKEKLASSKDTLQKHLQKLRAELESQQNLLQDLEEAKSTMQIELKENKANSAEVQKLQKEVSRLQSNLEEVKDKMERSSKDLSRELAKNKSSAKHSQSLQSKQDTLLQRIDDLDRENEELKDQVATIEEEKEAAEESLQRAMEQVNNWQKKVKDDEKLIESLSAEKEHLQSSISTLEKDIHKLEEELENVKERERLMIEYPDLNGPVNPDIKGTGDIVLDMENQVKANTVRIHILEDQNEGLRNSISKVMTLQSGGANPPMEAWTEQTTKPLPLWNHDNLQQAQLTNNQPTWNQRSSVFQGNENMNRNNSVEPGSPSEHEQMLARAKYVSTLANSPEERIRQKPLPNKQSPQKLGGEEFVVGRSTRPPSAKKKERPHSATTSGKMITAPANISSISAYKQIKKASQYSTDGCIDVFKGARPPSLTGKSKGVPDVTDPHNLQNYSKKEMFSCEKCDKMYSRYRDLHIHKSYCTG